MLISGEHRFAPEALEMLNALLDLMIPASPDGRMPAACVLGLFDQISDLDDASRETALDGLAQLTQLSEDGHGQRFAALDAEAQKSLLAPLREQAPQFFRWFTAQAASRYYRHPQVLELLGLPESPPWPRGNEIIAGDWSLLDPVRQRAPFYRPVVGPSTK